MWTYQADPCCKKCTYRIQNNFFRSCHNFFIDANKLYYPLLIFVFWRTSPFWCAKAIIKNKKIYSIYKCVVYIFATRCRWIYYGHRTRICSIGLAVNQVGCKLILTFENEMFAFLKYNYEKVSWFVLVCVKFRDIFLINAICINTQHVNILCLLISLCMGEVMPKIQSLNWIELNWKPSSL